MTPGLSEDQLQPQSPELIIETLKRFGVKAEGREITPGATITRYEVFPGEGVRVDKITSLKPRPLPRAARGEDQYPRAHPRQGHRRHRDREQRTRSRSSCASLLESRDWRNTHAKIPIALGKDVYGQTLVADLAAMPHMLIGGTTGSGKSVCINCILMSLLYKFTPERTAPDPHRSEAG